MMNVRVARVANGAERMLHEAHLGNDPEVIYHCPFCGSGALSGGPDGSCTCGVCEKTYMVFIQPTFSGTPADQAPGTENAAGSLVEDPANPSGADPLAQADSFTDPNDELAGVPPFELVQVASREELVQTLAKRLTDG